MPASPEHPAIEARLGLWDAVSLVIGIIIGAGIFKFPAEVFKLAPGPVEAIGVWALGGLLALVGAFCFAELASTYPRSGGEYVYLGRAFGPAVSFLFAWAQLAVIRPAGIAVVACIFGDYATRLWNIDVSAAGFIAVLAILGLTGINILGVTLGKNTQNALSIAKLIGLGMIIVAGLVWARPHPAISVRESQPLWFAPAMICVLWTFSGWNEAAYVTAEIKDKHRNVPLALLLGTGIVTIIYLLVNISYLYALGFAHASTTAEPAEDLLAGVPTELAAPAFLVLVMISALSGANGMIFTTARIYSVFGADHHLFSTLSHWSRTLGTPLRALAVQGVLSAAFVGIASIFWEGDKTLLALVECTAAVFWTFFLLTGISLFVLRWRDPHIERPFTAPGYPLLPLMFCGCCAYMVFGSIQYDAGKSLIGFGLVLAGLPLYFIPRKPPTASTLREPVGTYALQRGQSAATPRVG